MVVGLGPAGPELVTAAALDAHRRSRTAASCGRRAIPSAAVVADATTFDHLYEEADTFADVYTAIADELVAPRTSDGAVLYAVPGSPFVLERSVRHLLADPRVDVAVVPGLSFLDLAYARLGIDPVEAGVRLVDGHEFAVAAAGERGPMLVAHAHARSVLSDIKLAVDGAGRRDEVVVLQRLGLPDEAVLTVRGRSSTGASSPTTSPASTSRGSRRRSARSWSASTGSCAACATSARGTASRRTRA